MYADFLTVCAEQPITTTASYALQPITTTASHAVQPITTIESYAEQSMTTFASYSEQPITTTAAYAVQSTSTAASLAYIDGSSGGLTPTSSASKIVQIFQFKAHYSLSDITNDIQSRMTAAVARLLQVNFSAVILSFSSFNLRQIVRPRVLLQQESVLVTVGLIDFQGSIAVLKLRISQEKVNEQMAAENLLPVQLTADASDVNTLGGIVFDEIQLYFDLYYT